MFVYLKRASKYIHKAKIDGTERDINKSTIVGRHFKSPLLIIDRISREKIGKDIEDLKTPSINLTKLIFIVCTIPKWQNTIHVKKCT